MKDTIISIGREFGSGGRRIAQLLAKELEIPCYDRHLIEEASECSGIEKEELEKADEMTANRFLYTVPAKANPFTGYGKPMTDTLFAIQSNLIEKYAEKGSCVIVGRCAEKVLENHKGLISIFIYAPAEKRIEELMRRYDTDREEAAYLMKQADKIRKNYCSYYGGIKWGDRSSYDLMIDSSRFSDREVAAMICGIITERKSEEQENAGVGKSPSLRSADEVGRGE